MGLARFVTSRFTDGGEIKLDVHFLLKVSNIIESALTHLTRSSGGSMRQFFLPIRMLTIGFALAIDPSVSWSQVSADMCGDFTGLQWDYRTATQKQHIEVEGAHFVPKVEALISGNRGRLGGDLSYTLRASPNHHRALVSVMRWSERLNSVYLPDLQFQVECYFERGIRFAPNDHVVRMLYAEFLIGKARLSEATKQIEAVAETSADNGFTMYNVGLLYYDMKDYGHALTYAHKSMTLGFFRPELRARLEKVGRWTEPVAGAAGPVAPTSPQTPSAIAPSAAPAKD
jgi:hypothetical protein